MAPKLQMYSDPGILSVFERIPDNKEALIRISGRVVPNACVSELDSCRAIGRHTGRSMIPSSTRPTTDISSGAEPKD